MIFIFLDVLGLFQQKYHKMGTIKCPKFKAALKLVRMKENKTKFRSHPTAKKSWKKNLKINQILSKKSQSKT